MGVGLTRRGGGSTAPGWRVVGASVEGTRHRGTGMGCQDAHRFSIVGSTLVLVVADGAGSASRAAEGAQLAVDAAHRSLSAAAALGLPSDDGSEEACVALATDALECARQQLVTATDASCDCATTTLADFATTLAAVVASPRMLFGARVGDGAIALRGPGGVSLALPPDRSEYLNETSFLTSRDWQQHVRTFCHDDAASVTGVAALTDGLQLLAFDLVTGAAHVPFFEPLYAFAAAPEATSEELAGFLDSERVNARTDDDKTLVVAARA